MSWFGRWLNPAEPSTSEQTPEAVAQLLASSVGLGVEVAGGGGHLHAEPRQIGGRPVVVLTINGRTWVLNIEEAEVVTKEDEGGSGQ